MSAPTATPRCTLHARCRGEDEGPVQAARTARLDTLSAALGFPVQPPEPVAPARLRVSLRPGPDGAPGWSLPGTHQHAEVRWCGLAHPAIQQAMAALPLLPKGTGSVELRTDAAHPQGGGVVLAARARKPRFRKAVGAALKPLVGTAGIRGVAVDGRRVAGDVLLRWSVGGVAFELSPDTFTQVQADTNAALAAAVRAEVDAVEAEAVLDLYSGCGNLGLPLLVDAPRRRLTAIESGKAAVADVRRAAAAAGLDADLREGDANAFSAGDAFFDVAVLDPPRAGAPGVLAQVVVTRPKAVVFVSCNPGHLARDLRPATDAGYRLHRAQAFDMFPGTEHLEVLAVLRRD